MELVSWGFSSKYVIVVQLLLNTDIIALNKHNQQQNVYEGNMVFINN